MFITQAKEILEAVPTAKFDEKAATKLLGWIEEEENQMLEPLLGDALLAELASKYQLLLATYRGITASGGVVDTLQELEGFTEDAQRKTIGLLRNIQRALVYRMMANKMYTISTSFNLGGGANRSSAGDYDPADDKHLAETRKECFMNSRHACDNILYTLERDAKTDHLWTELWQESDGYFYKEDLLFPTMRSMKPYFKDLCNQPSVWLALTPTIRYCQDTYIAPRVHPELMQHLLDPTYTLSDCERRAHKLLATSLAYYVRAKEGTKEERSEAFQAADSAFSTFEAFFNMHQDQLVEVEEAPKEDAPEEQKSTKPTCACCEEQKGRGDDYQFISTLVDPVLNRW